jgi:hypothetical protein
MTMASCITSTAPSALTIWVNEMACLTQAKNLIDSCLGIRTIRSA